MIELTPLQISKAFPGAQLEVIKYHWPFVRDALYENMLNSPQIIAYALATIAAESAGFVPISEMKSRFNTKIKPFDVYNNRQDLGNGPNDGEKYRGRGFVQLTGRHNYRVYGERIGRNLEQEPEDANDPQVAAQLLALFVADKEGKIKEALAHADYQKARKLVNGGTHGINQFEHTYLILIGIMK